MIAVCMTSSTVISVMHRRQDVFSENTQSIEHECILWMRIH